jgi:hypothetical protein
VTAAFGAKVDAFAAKPPRKRSRKPKPATAISFDPFALTPATPEQFEAAMKVYEGAMAPSAVPCRVVLDEPPCSLRATRAAVVTSACLPAPLPGLTLKVIRAELKDRYAVVGGTRPELLDRVRQMLQGTYKFQYVRRAHSCGFPRLLSARVVPCCRCRTGGEAGCRHQRRHRR